MADKFKSRFLLASLHIEAILRETSIARRGKRLKAVKDGAGLGDAYNATLERIKTQGGEKTKLAMSTLLWVCHAERPLQVDELRHALAVEIGATDFDSENPLYSPRVSLCPPGPLQSTSHGNCRNLLDLFEFTTGQEPPIPPSPRPPNHAIPQLFFEVLGNTCE